MKFRLVHLALVFSTANAAAPSEMAQVAVLTISKADAKTTVKLPVGTVSVDFRVQGAELYCKRVKLFSDDGSSSTAFLNSEMPLNFHEKLSGKGSHYLSADVDCHAVAKDGQLVISAGKSP